MAIGARLGLVLYDDLVDRGSDRLLLRVVVGAIVDLRPQSNTSGLVQAELGSIRDQSGHFDDAARTWAKADSFEDRFQS
jgi:hypothetical protein